MMRLRFTRNGSFLINIPSLQQRNSLNDVYIKFGNSGSTFTLRERLLTHEIFTKDKIVVVLFFLITTSSP